jgi:cell wall-associated NlpC family hydrolase
VAALAVTILPAALPDTASADPIEDQRAVVARVTDQLEALQQQSDQLAEDYAQAMTEQADLTAQVSAAEQRVAEQQRAVDALHDQLAEIAVQVYMGAGVDGSSPMFNSTSGVTDSLARDQLTRVAVGTGAASTDEYEQALADLRDTQDDLAAAKDAAADKAEQIDAAKAATDEQTVTFTAAREEAEAELGQLIQEEEERRARESYERMQREAEAAAARERAAAEAAATQQRQAQTVQAAARPAAATPQVAIPAASSRAGTAVAAALSQQGVPYVGYKASPSEGFDCSGLTMWAWAQAGVSLPHYSKAQYEMLPKVPKDQAQPGDLLFFHSPISHVSMYIGNGQHVSAPHTGAVVRVSGVNWGSVVGVSRPG